MAWKQVAFAGHFLLLAEKLQAFGRTSLASGGGALKLYSVQFNKKSNVVADC
jgi:hypothetical protein